MHYQSHVLFRPTLVCGKEKGLSGKENYPDIYLQKLNETREKKHYPLIPQKVLTIIAEVKWKTYRCHEYLIDKGRTRWGLSIYNHPCNNIVMIYYSHSNGINP